MKKAILELIRVVRDMNYDNSNNYSGGYDEFNERLEKIENLLTKKEKVSKKQVSKAIKSKTRKR